MSGSFDPYYKWLGIPTDEQPPSHYRLLGIRPFESDPDVIETAADRQTGHLQRYESGEHSEAAARLMSRVSRARLCLLDATKKANYDTDKQDNANDTAPILTPANGQTVNLLELVDPSRHVFSGGWNFDGEALVSAGGQTYDGITIPYEPPAEYDVVMICERR